jgi:hypothetical protein
MCSREHMPAADQRGGAVGFKSALTVHGGKVHGEIDHPGHLSNVSVRTTGNLCKRIYFYNNFLNFFKFFLIF